MDNTLIIFGSVALAALAVLCVTAAIMLVKAVKNLDRMTVTVESMGNDVNEIKSEVTPLLQRTTAVMEKADSAVNKIDESLDQLTFGTKAVRGIAEDTRKLEQELVERVRPALNDLTGLANSVVSGLTAFVRSIMDR